jgi:hypothetical protein
MTTAQTIQKPHVFAKEGEIPLQGVRSERIGSV